MSIKILSSGWGNINKLRTYFGCFSNVEVITEVALKTNEVLILPGVGNFEFISNSLLENKIRSKIDQHILNGGRLIGICSGFQILFDSSDESNLPGLGILKGKVSKLSKLNIGWHSMETNGGDVYFMNRYGVLDTDLKKQNDYEFQFTNTQDGSRILSYCRSEKILGMQFHPEVSRDACERLVGDFIK